MRVLALAAVAAFGVSALLGGSAPMGRILLALGLPELAVPLFTDPSWRGVALYRAGRIEDAAKVWVRAPYNRGNALVQLGNYAAALEAYDIAILQGHPDAQANFDLVASYYAGLGLGADALALIPKRQEGPSEEGFVARGDARAAGSGSEVTNANTMLGLAELDSRGRLGVRRVFDDTFIVADERWLNQLEDVPGEFMRARILAEHTRRQAAGLSPPEAEDPQ